MTEFVKERKSNESETKLALENLRETVKEKNREITHLSDLVNSKTSFVLSAVLTKHNTRQTTLFVHNSNGENIICYDDINKHKSMKHMTIEKFQANRKDLTLKFQTIRGEKCFKCPSVEVFQEWNSKISGLL